MPNSHWSASSDHSASDSSRALASSVEQRVLERARAQSARRADVARAHRVGLALRARERGALERSAQDFAELGAIVAVAEQILQAAQLGEHRGGSVDERADRLEHVAHALGVDAGLVLGAGVARVGHRGERALELLGRCAQRFVNGEREARRAARARGRDLRRVGDETRAQLRLERLEAIAEALDRARATAALSARLELAHAVSRALSRRAGFARSRASASQASRTSRVARVAHLAGEPARALEPAPRGVLVEQRPVRRERAAQPAQRYAHVVDRLLVPGSPARPSAARTSSSWRSATRRAPSSAGRSTSARSQLHHARVSAAGAAVLAGAARAAAPDPERCGREARAGRRRPCPARGSASRGRRRAR